MKRSLISILAISALLFTGCQNLDSVKAQVAGANIEIAKAKIERLAKPLVDVRVPIPNCSAPEALFADVCVILVTVREPSTGGSNEYIPNPDDPWARVTERAVGGLITVGGIYTGSLGAAMIAKEASSGIVEALKVQPAPTVVNTERLISPEVIQLPPPEVIQLPVTIVDREVPIIIPAAP